MAKIQPSEQTTGNESRKPEQLSAVIGQHVMHQLGKPSGLHWVHVRRLWEDYYRVNVLTGDDFVSAKVTNSYFLKVDGAGTIVGATPAITKQY